MSHGPHGLPRVRRGGRDTAARRPGKHGRAHRARQDSLHPTALVPAARGLAFPARGSRARRPAHESAQPAESSIGVNTTPALTESRAPGRRGSVPVTRRGRRRGRQRLAPGRPPLPARARAPHGPRARRRRSRSSSPAPRRTCSLSGARDSDIPGRGIGHCYSEGRAIPHSLGEGAGAPTDSRSAAGGNHTNGGSLAFGCVCPPGYSRGSGQTVNKWSGDDDGC